MPRDLPARDTLRKKIQEKQAYLLGRLIALERDALQQGFSPNPAVAGLLTGELAAPATTTTPEGATGLAAGNPNLLPASEAKHIRLRSAEDCVDAVEFASDLVLNGGAKWAPISGVILKAADLASRLTPLVELEKRLRKVTATIEREPVEEAQLVLPPSAAPDGS
jgi:hypothetical protein